MTARELPKNTLDTGGLRRAALSTETPSVLTWLPPDTALGGAGGVQQGGSAHSSMRSNKRVHTPVTVQNTALQGPLEESETQGIEQGWKARKRFFHLNLISSCLIYYPSTTNNLSLLQTKDANEATPTTHKLLNTAQQAKNKLMACVTGRKTAERCQPKSTCRLAFTGCWSQLTARESVSSLSASTGLDKSGVPSSSCRRFIKGTETGTD